MRRVGALRHDRKLKAAFAALTPGRQREYNLHFGMAKQSPIRIKRFDEYKLRISGGKGMRD